MKKLIIKLISIVILTAFIPNTCFAGVERQDVLAVKAMHHRGTEHVIRPGLDTEITRALGRFCKWGLVLLPATIAIMLFLHWWLASQGIDYIQVLDAKTPQDIANAGFRPRELIHDIPAILKYAVYRHLLGVAVFGTRDLFGQWVVGGMVRIRAWIRGNPFRRWDMSWQPHVALHIARLSFLMTGIKILYFPFLNFLPLYRPFWTPEWVIKGVIAAIPMAIGFLAAFLSSGNILRMGKRGVAGPAKTLSEFDARVRREASVASRVPALTGNYFIFNKGWFRGNFLVAAETLYTFFTMGVIVSGGTKLSRESGILLSVFIIRYIKRALERLTGILRWLWQDEDGSLEAPLELDAESVLGLATESLNEVEDVLNEQGSSVDEELRQRLLRNIEDALELLRSAIADDDADPYIRKQAASLRGRAGILRVRLQPDEEDSTEGAREAGPGHERIVTTRSSTRLVLGEEPADKTHFVLIGTKRDREGEGIKTTEKKLSCRKLTAELVRAARSGLGKKNDEVNIVLIKTASGKYILTYSALSDFCSRRIRSEPDWETARGIFDFLCGEEVIFFTGSADEIEDSSKMKNKIAGAVPLGRQEANQVLHTFAQLARPVIGEGAETGKMVLQRLCDLLYPLDDAATVDDFTERLAEGLLDCNMLKADTILGNLVRDYGRESTGARGIKVRANEEGMVILTDSEDREICVEAAQQTAGRCIRLVPSRGESQNNNRQNFYLEVCTVNEGVPSVIDILIGKSVWNGTGFELEEENPEPAPSATETAP